MEFLTTIYFIYTFLAFYFLLIYVLTYTQNFKRIHEVIKPNKNYSLSIVVPCYNESESIGKNIEALMASDYKGLKKILVVDDCSTDNSYEVIKKYAKKYPQVIALQTPKNTGNAAGAKNYGAKFVKTELIGFSDADSFPLPNAMSDMVGFFNDEKVGAVTSRVLVKNKQKTLGRVQAIEYKIIAFTRKILGFLDSIYVTNGPLSIYRKKAYDQVGGFDETNMTEDIEITWHIISKGWDVRMSIPAKAYTVAPDKISDWFKQRIRWNVGGFQTTAKYIKQITHCGMLGLFIMPLFTISWFIGLTGLFFLTYRVVDYVWVKFLAVKYSLLTGVPAITSNDLAVSPTLLFFLGLTLFAIGLAYTFTAILYSREKGQRTKLRDTFIYSIFYLLMYPPLLIVSFYRYLRGYNKW